MFLKTFLLGKTKNQIILTENARDIRPREVWTVDCGLWTGECNKVFVKVRDNKELYGSISSPISGSHIKQIIQ